MNTTIIYLIRHSIYLKDTGILNVDDNDQVKNEKIILSIEGEIKANELSQMEELQNIDVLWSSNYVRAKQTAKYIAARNDIEINIDSRFGERKLGDLKTLGDLGNIKKHSYTIEQLLDSELKNKDGESRHEVNIRMKSAINDILNNDKGKRIAIVSHGMAIKSYLMDYCTLNDEFKLTYNNNIIETNSPGIIKLTFTSNSLIDIEQII